MVVVLRRSFLDANLFKTGGIFLYALIFFAVSPIYSFSWIEIKTKPTIHNFLVDCIRIFISYRIYLELKLKNLNFYVKFAMNLRLFYVFHTNCSINVHDVGISIYERGSEDVGDDETRIWISSNLPFMFLVFIAHLHQIYFRKFTRLSYFA